MLKMHDDNLTNFNYHWKNVADRHFMNAEHIFPLQQRDILKIVEKAKTIPEISKVIIFGSSVTPLCNPWSDIDVYIVQDNVNTKITFEDLEAPVDKWTNFTVDDELLEEIMEKGVCVYEK